MEDFKFKSQVCTTREQSERLVALGLKKETADMVYHYSSGRVMIYELRAHPPTLKHTTHLNIDKLNVFKHKKPDGSIMTGEEYFEELWGKDIPAWSLHRLLSMLPDDAPNLFWRLTNASIEYEDESGDTDFFSHTTCSMYDSIIMCIGWLITIGYFNKDYLEDKQCEK